MRRLRLWMRRLRIWRQKTCVRRYSTWEICHFSIIRIWWRVWMSTLHWTSHLKCHFLIIRIRWRGRMRLPWTSHSTFAPWIMYPYPFFSIWIMGHVEYPPSDLTWSVLQRFNRNSYIIFTPLWPVERKFGGVTNWAFEEGFSRMHLLAHCQW